MAFPSTFSTLQDSVIARVRLDPVDDLDAVKDWINQAYAEACVECEAIVVSGTLTLTAGVSSYDISGSDEVARLKTIYITGGSVSVPAVQVSLDEIIRLRTAVGQPSGTQTRFALVGYKTLELWPAPSAGNALVWYYVAFPGVLVSAADIPILQEPYATKLLEAGAMAKAADFKSDPSAPDYQAAFEEGKAEYRQHLRLRQGGKGRFEFEPDIFVPNDPATIPPFGW